MLPDFDLIPVHSLADLEERVFDSSVSVALPEVAAISLPFVLFNINLLDKYKYIDNLSVFIKSSFQI